MSATSRPNAKRHATHAIQKPTGLRYTIVNGVVTFEGYDCTGALPGKLLRGNEMVG